MLQSRTRTQKTKNNPLPPSSIVPTNKKSRRGTTKKEETDYPPQLSGSRGGGGEGVTEKEKRILLPQSTDLSAAATAVGMRDRQCNSMSVFEVTAVMVVGTGQ